MAEEFLEVPNGVALKGFLGAALMLSLPVLLAVSRERRRYGVCCGV